MRSVKFLPAVRGPGVVRGLALKFRAGFERSEAHRRRPPRIIDQLLQRRNHGLWKCDLERISPAREPVRENGSRAPSNGRALSQPDLA